jgi:hypothetical protein
MRSRYSIPFFTIAFATTSMRNARADDGASADIGAARELGLAGVKLADDGNCTEAIEKLLRSESMHHAPTVLGRLGECQVQIGKIVDGSENLNRVVRENLQANAPAAFLSAQERARQVLAAARPKIARLKVSVIAPNGAEFTVSIDGGVIPSANLNADRPIDPGPHQIAITGAGLKPVSARVVLLPGGTESVAMTVERAPLASKVAAGSAPEAQQTVEDPREPLPGAPAGTLEKTDNASHTPAIIAFSVGAAGIALGSVFGLIAASKNADLERSCPAKVCPTSKQGTLDSAKTMGWVSTIGFGAGFVGIALGAVLLVSQSGSRSRSSRDTFWIHPTIGLGSAGVAGAF